MQPSTVLKSGPPWLRPATSRTAGRSIPLWSPAPFRHTSQPRPKSRGPFQRQKGPCGPFACRHSSSLDLQGKTKLWVTVPPHGKRKMRITSGALGHRKWNCLHRSLPSLLCAVSGRPAHFLGPAKRGKPGTHMHDMLSPSEGNVHHVSAWRGQGSPLWRGIENTGPKVGTQKRWQTPKIHRLRRRTTSCPLSTHPYGGV